MQTQLQAELLALQMGKSDRKNNYCTQKEGDKWTVVRFPRIRVRQPQDD